jgi:tight adherence protein C
MNLTLIGALLGGLAAAGLLITVFATPPMRRPTMADRIAPYLTDAARPSRLLTGSVTGRTASAFSRLTAPLLRDAVRFIDKPPWIRR